MGIRGVPPGITDPNLRGFLQDIRNALAGVSEKVTKLSTTTTTSSGGGGGSGPGNGGGGNPPPDGGGGLPPGTQSSVVLSISPVKPLTQSPFTLTATVTGTFPTGTVAFTSGDSQLSDYPIALANGSASVTLTKPKGIYTFLASYSGDANNYSAISNSLTVEVGSVWDGPPPDMTSLIAESGINMITLKWTFPYTGDFDVVEVWGSTTNSRSTATKLGESNGSMFVYVPPDVSVSWYFWTRIRDSEGLFGNWYPNTTTGVKGTAFSLETEISNTTLWKDLGTQIGVDEANIATTSGIVSGPNGLAAQYMVKTDVAGLVSGFGLYNDGNISDFFVRADRFAVGSPATYKGTCSISGKTTQAECKAAGGTWTWASTSSTNIPFIVYTTTQTITAPDGSGKTLTIQPGVYIKSANIQQAFIGDAQIYGDLKSYSWAASNGPNTFPFNGWQLDKASNLTLYGGSFALYDSYGTPVITAGKINYTQFKRLILTSSSELFTIGKAPSTSITPSSITLTATLQNISGTVSWTVTSGTYSGSLPNGLTQTISPSSMTTSVVTFVASTTSDSVVYTDTITLAKVQDGSDALTMLLTNEAHTVPADTSGNVTSYSGASTVAQVFRGAEDVTVREGWSISIAGYSGCNYPYISGQTVALDSSHTLTADVATITIQAAESGSATLSRLFSVTKAKQGASGANGSNGTNGIRGSITTSVVISGGSFDPYAAYNTVNATWGTPVVGDVVLETNNGNYVETKYYSGGGNPGNWLTAALKVDGNLLVTGSVTAAALAANQVWSKQITIASGTGNYIRSQGFNPGTSGFNIDGSGNAEFYNVKVRGDVLLGGGNLVASSIGNQFVSGSPEYFLQSGYGADLSSYYYPSGYGSFRIHQALYTAPGNQYLKFNRPGGGQFPVAPGQWYQLSAYSGVTNCQVTAFIDWYDASGTSIVSASYGSTNSTYPGGYIFDDTTYKKVSVTAQAPSNAKYATVGFYKPQNDYYLEGYADITQVYFAPIPANYTAVIPWSPGGISLMDTLSLKTNSVTAVEFLNSSIYTDWSSQPSYEFGASRTSTITGKASLPITTNDVATNRIAQVVFQFTNSDSSAGWLIVYLKKYSSITGSTSTVESRVIDVPIRQTAGSNVSAQNLSFTVGVDAKEAATLSLDFSLVGGPDNYWKTGSRPTISYLNIICFTGKR